MQDTMIIDLYWERSQEAIVQSNQKYGAYCHSIAWNILKNQEDSEECVNDTWLHAWNAMPPQRPSFLKAFLGKITRNLSLNLFEKTHAAKRGGSEVELCLEELAECIPGDTAAERSADALVIREVLNRFLKDLKKDERMIFVQRYWYLRPVKEISDAFSCSESKVKMILLRSRKKLQSALEKEGFVL